MSRYNLLENDDYKPIAEVLGPYDHAKDYMGAGDGFGNRLVPRTLYGIDCNVAAYIHDYQYTIGGTEDDRSDADLEFYFNILWIVEKNKSTWPWGTRWLHAKLARMRAEKYYLAVKNFGYSSFFYHKKPLK